MESLPEVDVRNELCSARRVVVKIGSRALARDEDLPAQLAEQLSRLLKSGCCPLLVSSGATALGMKRLGMKKKPTEIARLQAAASAGQSILMRRYDEAFNKFGVVCAQVLLTAADLTDRNRVNNARAALNALLDAGVVPIVNENDVVATEELRFTDNDQLAAMVAPLVGADALILLTDVDGVLDEAGVRIGVLSNPEAFRDRGALTEGIGRGGMASKVDAALKGRRAGAAVVIAPATLEDVVVRVLAGEDVGTYFPLRNSVLRARQHWIAYALRPSGTILIDAGASRAIEAGEASLLAVGVLGVRGEFHPGDAVRVVTIDGKEIARGLSRMSSADVARSARLKGPDLFAITGTSKQVVIHRDDLVLND